MPTTDKSVDGMYEELLAYIRQISNVHLRQLLRQDFTVRTQGSHAIRMAFFALWDEH